MPDLPKMQPLMPRGSASRWSAVMMGRRHSRDPHAARSSDAAAWPVRTVRAGSKPCADRLGPGGVVALRHLEADLDVLGRIVAGGADALDHGGELGLVPIDPLRQVGDHGEVAVVEADGAGVLAGQRARLGGLVAVLQHQRAIEAGLRGLRLLQRGLDLVLQDREHVDGQLRDLLRAAGQAGPAAAGRSSGTAFRASFVGWGWG